MTTNQAFDDRTIPDQDGKDYDELDGKITVHALDQADIDAFHSPAAEKEPLALLDCPPVPGEGWHENVSSPSQWPAGFDAEEEVHLAAPNTKPANEEIVRTEPADATNGSEPSESKSVRDPAQKAAANVSVKPDIRTISKALQEQLINVMVQPTIDPRRRYKKEGKRRLKKLTSDLLTIDLSQLQNYDLTHVKVFWLRLSLITCSEDPQAIVYMHPDVLGSLSKMKRLQDGSLCVPILQSDIDQGYIKLKDLSIVRTKDNKFTFDLIPYDLKKIHTTWDTFPIDPTKKTAGNAKVFRRVYNTAASQIACQIIFQQGEQSKFTYITCETNVMNEVKRYQPKAKTSVKRAGKKRQKTPKRR